MQIVIQPPAPVGYMETVMFARPDAGMMNYFNQRNQELETRLTQYYGAAGQAFLTSTKNFYQEYKQNVGLEAAEQIVLMSNNALASNSGYLVPLKTVEELQSASGRYLDYLMSNPVVTELFYQNRLDGYGELYYDYQKGLVGEQRDAYRAVVTGMGQSYVDPNYDSEDETWIIYSQDEEHDVNPLLVTEQKNVLDAWNLQNIAIANNIDPTSLDGFEVRPE